MTVYARIASVGLALMISSFATGAMGALPTVESRPLEPSRLSMKQRVARLEHLIDGQVVLTLTEQVETLQAEVQALRGALELQAHQLQQLKQA